MLTKPTEARAGSMEVLQDASIAWRHIAQAGVTIDDVTQPSYWRPVAKECAQGRIAGQHAWNRIEVIAADGSWEAELRVVSVTDGIVQTRVIREWHEPKQQARKAKVPEGYVVEFISDNGWRALSPTKETLIEKQTSEDKALSAAVEHAKKMKGSD